MDTVRLLDTYRVAIVRDRDSVRLLAYLQKEGPRDEESLARLANLPLQRTRSKLTELFRSNLVVTESGRYSTSDLADLVLARTGISDLVAQDLIRASPIAEEHKTLLLSCTYGWESEPTEWRRYLSAAARSLYRLGNLINFGREHTLRNWYATIAGLDPTAHEFGAERYSHTAWSRLIAKDTPRGAGFDAFVKSCRVALTDREASNDFLLTGKQSTTGSIDTIMVLTFTRLVASAVSHYVDEGLAAAVAAEGIHSDAVGVLTEWARPFERDYVVLLSPTWRSAWGSENKGIIDVLLSIFRKQRNASAEGLPWRSLPIPSRQIETPFIATLRSLESGLATVSVGESAEALRILDRLRNQLANRAGASGLHDAES